MPPAEPIPATHSSLAAPGVSTLATSTRVGRTYHLHLPFLLYCGVSLLIAIGAFNSNNNLLFWLFALALSMLVVSGAVSGQMLMAVRLERERVESVHVGQRLTLRYRITNRNRRIPVFSLSIAEENRAPADPAARPEGFVPHIPARSTLIAESTGPATRRGTVPLSTIRITSEFPFGIVRKSLTFNLPAVAIVHPAPVPCDDSILRELTARAIRHERTSRVQTPGLGDEFLALREYSPGDTPRQIAWRASARRAGQNHHDLLVRQNAAGATPTAIIILDLTGAQDEPAFELAISQAAGVARAALGAGVRRNAHPTRLGLFITSTGQLIPPGTGPARMVAMLDALALLPRFADHSTIAPTGPASPPPGIARTAVLITPAAPPRVIADALPSRPRS